MAQKKSVPVKSSKKAPVAAKSKTKTKSKAAVVKAPVKKTAKKAVPKAAAVKQTSPAAKAKAKRASVKTSSTKKPVARTTRTTAKAPAKTAAAKTVARKTVAAKPAATKSAGKTVATKAIRPAARRTASASVRTAAKAPAAAAAKAKSRNTIKAVAAAVTKSVAKHSTPVAEATQPAAAGVPKKPTGQRHGFKTNEFIVYPAHGVGQIVAIEEQEIAGLSLELFVITFEKDKMTLRVPTGKHESVGMRKLAETDVVEKAISTLKGRARIKRTMWSRRAQEYEAKINSGDLISIAEVVRDLYRSESQPEQSYSERQLYEQALDRMAREIAAVERLDERGAVQRITDVLSKSAKGRRAAEEAAEAAEAEAAGADVEAA